MNEDLDGKGPQRVERTEQVTRRLSVKPEDDVSFSQHNKCLERERDRELYTDRCIIIYHFHRSVLSDDIRPFVIGRRGPAPPVEY